MWTSTLHFKLIYRGPSIDYSHTPAYTCSGHSNEPRAESAIINISKPASLSLNSLLVNEKKSNSPVVHAASSHQAWKIGANQQLYFETQSQNSRSCQIHAMNNLMGMAYLSYSMATEHFSRQCQHYGETWKYTYDPANGFSDSLIHSLLKSLKKELVLLSSSRTKPSVPRQHWPSNEAQATVE